MSRKTSSIRAVKLNSSSSAVQVPSTMSVWTSDQNDPFTATVSSVSSPQTVTLTATSNGISVTTVLQLTPSGTTPVLNLSSTSVAFGTDALNTTTTRTITLTSSGTAALTITSASVAGSSFGETGIGFPITLNPGQSAVLTLSFDPKAAGSFSGSVTINSNATSATISLSGTGQAPATLSAL
ncbi:MAG: choice-of-anchor D domain-containing protein, partial [Acidobacteriaceae bacterium]